VFLAADVTICSAPFCCSAPPIFLSSSLFSSSPPPSLTYNSCDSLSHQHESFVRVWYSLSFPLFLQPGYFGFKDGYSIILDSQLEFQSSIPFGDDVAMTPYNWAFVFTVISNLAAGFRHNLWIMLCCRAQFPFRGFLFNVLLSFWVC
jgi:hypothetical protein